MNEVAPDKINAPSPNEKKSICQERSARDRDATARVVKDCNLAAEKNPWKDQI
jgi:hypothetical protein